MLKPIRHRLGRAARDAGITFIELAVSMTIMGVVTAVFTTVVVQMFHSANRTQGSAAAQTQINLAFLRLDRELRYAAGISTPGQDASGWYVEYLRTDGAAPTCTQLWLDTTAHALMSRTWPKDNDSVRPKVWSRLASDVTATQPFTFIAAAAPAQFQRLRVQVQVTAQDGSGRTKAMDMTFTALNTSLTTASASYCDEGRP